MERLEGSPGVRDDALISDSVNVFKPNVLSHLLEGALPHFPIVGAVVLIGLVGVATIVLEANSKKRRPLPPLSPGLHGLLHCQIHASVDPRRARILTAEGELYSISPLYPAGCRGANVGRTFERAVRIERKVAP